MKIVIDVDGTLANNLMEWLIRYYQRYGEWIQPNTVTEYDVTSVMTACTKEEAFALLDDLRFYMTVRPLPYAQQMVRDLQDAGHVVTFVTKSLSIHDYAQKRAWLRRHEFFSVGDECDQLMVMSDRSMLRANILIDDYRKHVDDFNDAQPVGTGGAILVRSSYEPAGYPLNVIPQLVRSR